MASPSCLCCAVILPLRFAIFFSLHSTDFHLFTAQSLKFTVCLILSFFSFFFVQPHQFHITFNNEQFYIRLPDGSMINFPNRLGDVKYQHFDVSGDARIIGIKVK